FRQDAAKAIEKRFSNVAEVKFEAPVSDDLPNYEVDALIRKHGATPIAVYFATSENRVSEAVILWLESRYKHLAVKVLLLMEHAKPRHVTDRAFARALNHLDGVAVFRGHEIDSMDKIASHLQ